MYNEIKNGQVIFGVVTECSPENELMVQLDNGEYGVVSADEITFREFKQTPDMKWRVGRRFGYIARRMRADGLWELSGREYEQANYDAVKDDFESRRRNVYLGKLRSVNREGDLAFYELAYGVNGCMRLTDFCQVHLNSFNDITLPRYMPVAVRNIAGRDRIAITGKVAFGDFAYGIERMELDAGSEAVCYTMPRSIPGCEVIAQLSPNVLVKCDGIPANGANRVRITGIDPEKHHVYGELMDRMTEAGDFDYSAWIRPMDELDSWIDLAEFDNALNTVKRVRTESHRPEPPVMQPDDIEISYELNSANSPFMVRNGEKVIHEPFSGGKPYAIAMELNRGYLHDFHFKVANAVNELKYTSTYQLQRYLHLTEGLKLSEGKLRRIINRLVKHDIVGVVHFRTEDSRAIFDTLHPGVQFRSFTGKNPRFPSFEYNQQDPAVIKSRLAANQLLLGVLHSWEGVAERDTFPNLMLDDGLRVRPRHKVTMEDGRVYYLDSVREDRFENMADKLRRYDRYFAVTGEKAELVVTMETEEAAGTFAKRVKELALGFDVSLTCDLKCLPAPVLQRIPAAAEARRKGLLSRVLKMIGC